MRVIFRPVEPWSLAQRIALATARVDMPQQRDITWLANAQTGQRPARLAAPQVAVPATATRTAAARVDAVRTESLRLLLPVPGRKRSVNFGDARVLLESQLEHPDRLRPTHRLPCHVQICEAAAPQRFAALQAAFHAATESSVPLAPLDDKLGDALGIPHQFRTAAVPVTVWREPDVVLPGERFVALILIADPTLDGAQAALPQSRRAKSHELVRTPPIPQQEQPRRIATRAEPQSRQSIPDRYTQPWELVLSREEALYDISEARARRGVGSWIARLRTRIGRAARIRKWRALLYGCTADDQLWGVRPPRHGYQDREVITWAERMLAAAGYNPAQWLPEWELFWRRKGL